MHGNLFKFSTNFKRILALDLGKFNSVLCIYDPARRAKIHRTSTKIAVLCNQDDAANEGERFGWVNEAP